MAAAMLSGSALFLSLSGCSQQEFERFVGSVLLVGSLFVLAYFLLSLLAMAIFGLMVAVLIVNITDLLNNRPRMRWAVTALVISGFHGLGTLSLLLNSGRKQPSTVLFTLAFSVGYGIVGYLAVKRAQKLQAHSAANLPAPPT